MIQTKQSYETTFIVNASLEDTHVDTVVNHIQEIITRNGGEITAINRWGRKRLAYTIRKKNNGFYANIEFKASGPIIGQLERAFLLDENILRFLTIRLDKRALQARLQQAAMPEQTESQPPTIPVAPIPIAREPLFVDDTPEGGAEGTRS